MNVKKFPIGQTFAIAAPAAMTVDGFEDASHPSIPARKDYVFRNEHLRDILAYIANPVGDALYLTGPTGSGKTSLISQVAARLNWPVQQVTCHGRLELNDLIGQFMLVNGSMSFIHGPLAQAVRDGHLLILNEIDLMDPSELSGLNDIIEGQPLVIPQNGGEIINPHPKFRLIATGNSAGQGDQSGLYQGVMQQNLAFLDRFRLMEVSYPDASIEQSILKSVLTGMGVPFDSVMENLTEKMIQVANEIRRLFVGGTDGSGELSVTMSTRTLVRWTNLMIAYKRAPNALAYSLDRALTLRAEPAQREAIHRIAKDVFGDTWGDDA
ncbi:AAA family ATPase [Methylicorpusculum oleiharenae]|uniref:AAA family ATPase n=1 Tax=Methylicorpusculum oleiharenae TaxID=1338687 RepID=UPI0013577E6A|nr:AAA family ATPase [Methylicorpusculum oleiharenae]MBS3951721.1 AAA family ATPase [Methylomicrobium sp.]MCD2453626.1 AAA family ATPase [Methylicorpusculum oleiharenae]